VLHWMPAAIGEGALTLEVDMGGRLGRPCRSVKAIRRVWDGERDIAVTSVHKTLSGLNRRSGGTYFSSGQAVPKKSLPFGLWQDTLPYQFVDSGLC
jgi:hypothetical protein